MILAAVNFLIVFKILHSRPGASLFKLVRPRASLFKLDRPRLLCMDGIAKSIVYCLCSMQNKRILSKRRPKIVLATSAGTEFA